MKDEGNRHRPGPRKNLLPVRSKKKRSPTASKFPVLQTLAMKHLNRKSRKRHSRGHQQERTRCSKLGAAKSCRHWKWTPTPPGLPVARNRAPAPRAVDASIRKKLVSHQHQMLPGDPRTTWSRSHAQLQTPVTKKSFHDNFCYHMFLILHGTPTPIGQPSLVPIRHARSHGCWRRWEEHRPVRQRVVLQ